MTKVNGTDAKTIALHFLDATTDGRFTPAIIAKTVAQAKVLLSSGYKVDEIIRVIDYIVNQGVKMYSIGYVNHAINDILEKLREDETARIAQEEKRKLLDLQKAKQEEVNNGDESKQRNRDKSTKFGIQPRFREKHNLDMFEGK